MNPFYFAAHDIAYANDRFGSLRHIQFNNQMAFLKDLDKQFAIFYGTYNFRPPDLTPNQVVANSKMSRKFVPGKSVYASLSKVHILLTASFSLGVLIV